MSKKVNKHIVGPQSLNKRAFDDYRNFVLDEFTNESIFKKRKLSQAAYWTAIDKEIADQYFRDEVWIFGIKVRDEIKVIDHGFDGLTTKTVGFKK